MAAHCRARYRGINTDKSRVAQFKRAESDTGSSEVQIAQLTARVQQLTAHLQVHRKDYASTRGLMKVLLLARLAPYNATLKPLQQHGHRTIFAILTTMTCHFQLKAVCHVSGEHCRPELVQATCCMTCSQQLLDSLCLCKCRLFRGERA